MIAIPTDSVEDASLSAQPALSSDELNAIYNSTLENVHALHGHVQVLLQVHRQQQSHLTEPFLKAARFPAQEFLQGQSEGSVDLELLSAECRTWRSKYERLLNQHKLLEANHKKTQSELRECREELEKQKNKLQHSQQAESAGSTRAGLELRQIEALVTSERESLRRAVQKIPQIFESHVSSSYIPMSVYETKRDELKHAHLQLIHSKAKDDALAQQGYHGDYLRAMRQEAGLDLSRDVYQSVSSAFKQQVDDLQSTIRAMTQALEVERAAAKTAAMVASSAEAANKELLDMLKLAQQKKSESSTSR